MNHYVREAIEEREASFLGPFAALSAKSAGRAVPIEEDPVRTCFQRDRDRILHSKSFRRLKYKTQVFISPQGDHYRTRLTHTLEVSQISRTIGRALRLNEDLIEAIALGHDVGHTPFGHVGERALDEALQEATPGRQFRHYEQSLRIVNELERLNLTAEVRNGIGGHSKGAADLSDADGVVVSTLEAAVVRVSDRIAYLNHDLDDAVRSGILSEIPREFLVLGQCHGHRIGTMVEDVIRESIDQPQIRFSSQILPIMNDLKDFLFDNVYFEYPRRYPDIEKAAEIVKELFQHFAEAHRLPPDFPGDAVDYVAGMTDRFAMETFARLRLPEGFRAPR